ncbi:calcium homeostasis endoplasmic reticulum protein isoform X1 [Diorhabda sublineata]|uniref:calcium homeostasis endoplasmic reticulum protein isoform X1 n=2 Tax=Diorhabda sublineata TaxID=1163346 RepID=UPI0024E15E43|nr:calcium homeostasis endoplasmic reticulum protein isoform X1 [Diorhabda sublineata]XP_056635773.1 calcium homeostasis endoplasmic reticulum protein isoform X1 [Diorhabda sublineata]
MDLPQPPQDTELRNIIDKLAQFVARNGPEFELMTKNKQKGNPKFQFLYGGEYYNYYQYKVSTEQAIFKQQQQQGVTITDQENSWNTPPPQMQHSAEIEQISKQQDSLREQIKQSEQNLTAQHSVLLQQQQTQVEQTVKKCETADLQKEADTCDVSLTEIHNILQPIIDSCTKDSISNGKSWFLQHATTKEKAQCIVECLLHKVLQTGVFSQKLHVIYLVNDLLHHSARKNAIDLKDALERVVVPMFCNASISAREDQRQKLDKLLKLWESKTNYLKPETLEQMRSPLISYQQYQADQVAKYTTEVAALAQQTKDTFDGYQAQHQAFVCHAMQQIMDLQQQKQNLEQTMSQPQIQPPVNAAGPNPMVLESMQQNIQSLNQVSTANTQAFPIQTISSSHHNDNYMEMNISVPPPSIVQNSLNHSFNSNNANIPVFPSTPDLCQQPPPLGPSSQNGIESITFTQPPPGYLPPPGMFPDFSKPPPGFPVIPEPQLEELMPTAPYYDLPAGLMVPLVKLEETSYKPLDPKDIRLPPPAPPSDRLLAAVEAFYSLPSHERPRDSEGWEKLGLYEYYKAKNIAKKEKDELIQAGLRQKSRSPSPVVLPSEKDPTPPKRRYQSKSPTPQPHLHRTTRRSRSRSRSKSRSRSPRRRYRDRSDRDRDSRNDRDRDSRSDRDSRNDRESRRERRRRSRTRSRSKSRSPIRRSISPTVPSFGNLNLLHNTIQELDSSNKGHQMLKKMGWGGSGLGANEQGIDTPISGGDVRDRQDQFKGVGCNLNDPYENFRKNKGAAFITRMKARAEERAAEKSHGSKLSQKYSENED